MELLETQKYQLNNINSLQDDTVTLQCNVAPILSTAVIQMELLEIQKYQKKNKAQYYCKTCDYITSVKSNYKKHLMSKKHADTFVSANANINAPNYVCNKCGHQYATKSGLWKHSKTCVCKMLLNVIKKDDQVKDFLMEQNKQLIEQLTVQNNKLMEQNNKLMQTQTSCTNNSNTIINNSHNKFSINVFLNEQCKDALNITDFINSLVLSVKDLEDTSRLGYVEGISRIFIDGLNQLDICKRPVHCSDLKRDIIYIKDEDQWSKDNETKDKITKAIKYIANKNIKQIVEWQKMNKDYLDPSSKQNDRYMKMLCEVMSGSTKDEQTRNYQKIIKNVSKEVVIDKDKM
jgi:hypothetical protein